QGPAERRGACRDAHDQVEVRRTFAAVLHAEAGAAKAERVEALELVVAHTVIEAADHADVAVIGHGLKTVDHKAEVGAVDLRVHDHEPLEAERAPHAAEILEAPAGARPALRLAPRRL